MNQSNIPNLYYLCENYIVLDLCPWKGISLYLAEGEMTLISNRQALHRSNRPQNWIRFEIDRFTMEVDIQLKKYESTEHFFGPIETYDYISLYRLKSLAEYSPFGRGFPLPELKTFCDQHNIRIEQYAVTFLIK